MYKIAIAFLLIALILWNAYRKTKKEGFSLTPKISIPKFPRLKLSSKLNSVLNKTKRKGRHKKNSITKETMHMIKKYIS